MRTLKLRASLILFVLVVFGMLAVSAGDLVAKSQRAMSVNPIGAYGGAGLPDSLYGGGNDPNTDSGDPDDLDLNLPFLIWFVGRMF